MKKPVVYECQRETVAAYGMRVLRSMRRARARVGRIVYAVGRYGNDSRNPTILINTLDVQDSPWFYSCLMEFMQEQAGTGMGEVGKVYVFEGSFAKLRFEGFISEAELLIKP